MNPALFFLPLLLILFLSPLCSSDPLSDLENQIKAHGGQVISVTDPTYHNLSILWNPIFQSWPSLILRPATYDDVATILKTLFALKIPLRILGGRHSYGGYCSHEGIVLDTSLLSNITIDEENQIAILQAGVKWEQVYERLENTPYVALGGLCPTVGVMGFTQGGGYNSQYSRSLGFALDNALSFLVVLANGTTLRVDSENHVDLFWALRGGGGGNFGVVLEVTHKIHKLNVSTPRGELPWYNITWTGSKSTFRSVLSNWFEFLEKTADNDQRITFDVYMYISEQQESRNYLSMYGAFYGSETELKSIFSNWLSLEPRYSSFDLRLANQMYIEKNLGGPDNPFPSTTRMYVVSALTTGITDAMLDVLMNCTRKGKIDAGLDIIYLKGSLKTSSAWPFPSVKFDIAPGFLWDSPDDDAEGLAWGSAWRNMLFQVSGDNAIGSYLNYIDPYLENWEKLYYGNNLPRLQSIKLAYDPTNYFTFPQGILPY